MRWTALLMVLGLLSQATQADPEISADLTQEVLDLLTPLLGDVHDALQVVINIGKIGMGVGKFIDIVSNQVFNASLKDMNFGSYIPLADRKILAMFEYLTHRLDEVEHGVHGVGLSLRDLAQGMQDMVRWEIQLDTMEQYMLPINTLYKRFTIYLDKKEEIEDYTLQNFADEVVSESTHSVKSLMAKLHGLVVPEASLVQPLTKPSDTYASLNDPKDVYHVADKVKRKLETKEKLFNVSKNSNDKMSKFVFRPGIFEMLHQAIKSSDNCVFRQSPQQMVNGLHVMLALTEARGYAMIEFAYMILKVYNEGNFTVEREIAKSMYNTYSEDMLKEARKILLKASKEYYTCDPEKYIDGDTHVQFTELLQGYIENEVDMNSDTSCTQSCSYYQHTKSESCYMPTKQYCGKHRRCRGTIHNCKFYDADAWVCLSRNPYRRYDSIEYESGLRLGSSSSCTGRSIKVDSWWRWFVHCSYCLCLCDDPESPTTDRFVSLMPAFSDTRNNMIVTGLKFMKQQRVIHIQIQQGKALPQGQVNMSTVQWVPVEPINIISTAYQEGTHFKQLSFEDRNIDLDQLAAPETHVVTGVRFRMLGAHINLEMQVTPVNYSSGELEPTKSYWISNDNTPAMAKNPRKQFPVDDLDDPTKFVLPNKQDTEPDSWIRFSPTSRGADVAQLTVPFFDAQVVSPLPSSWLSGIELYHKGQPGSGGFLGLKVSTYDITQHMETPKDAGTNMLGSLPSTNNQHPVETTSPSAVGIEDTTSANYESRHKQTTININTDNSIFDLQLVVDNFAECMKEDGQLQIDGYLRAYSEINKIFPLLGTMFDFVASDIQEKITILEHYREGHAGHYYSSIQSMIEYEIKNGLINSEENYSGSRTLLRLHRALEFISGFLSEFHKAPYNSSLGSITSDVYDNTLAKFHDWFFAKTVNALLLLMPTKKTVVEEITGGDPTIQAKNEILMPKAIEVMIAVYNSTQKLYEEYNILNLP